MEKKLQLEKVLVLCDNDWISVQIEKIFSKKGFDVLICKSDLFNYSWSSLIGKYDLVISAHCKKIFDKKLVDSIRIVNIHPGLNPFNRGMYPHIFSIINGLPTGATIHEVDEFIDNGDIIAQQEVEIFMHDDSRSLHERIMKLEMELFERHFDEILLGTYTKKKPQCEGNLNYKKDFSNLCNIDLKNYDSFENHINTLRALSYGGFKNAYFYDNDGNKIYIRVELSKNNSEKL